jgi:hypothetical protein
MKLRIVFCCSRCGSVSFRHSISHRFGDGLLACLGIYPHRCYNCRVRFYLFRPAYLTALVHALGRPIVAEPQVNPAAEPAQNRRAMVASAGDLIRH